MTAHRLPEPCTLARQVYGKEPANIPATEEEQQTIGAPRTPHQRRPSPAAAPLALTPRRGAPVPLER